MCLGVGLFRSVLPAFPGLHLVCLESCKLLLWLPEPPWQAARNVNVEWSFRAGWVPLSKINSVVADYSCGVLATELAGWMVNYFERRRETTFVANVVCNWGFAKLFYNGLVGSQEA